MENITLSINSNCELIATPNSFDEVKDRYFLEFIINPNINPNDTVRISNTRSYYTQGLCEDGLYVYYMITMPSKTLIEEGYPDLYYDHETKKLMLDNKELTDVTTLLNRLEPSSGAIEYTEIPLFSICKLKKCILEIQRNAIINCRKHKCENIINVNNEFLFISLYVLEALIGQGRYAEADEVLSSVNSCSSVCNSVTHRIKNCNCNG